MFSPRWCYWYSRQAIADGLFVLRVGRSVRVGWLTDFSILPQPPPPKTLEPSLGHCDQDDDDGRIDQSAEAV